jgi:AcrR family transcriptional regulator
MSELTKATKLTKGAIYGNFESKEDLAVQAFNFNVRKIIWVLADIMNTEPSAAKKLFAMTNFYRGYYKLTKKYGGCPLLNVGVDSKNQNPALSKRVKEIVQKLVKNVADIIREGIRNKEFRSNVDADVFALRIFSIIEGGVYTTTILDNGDHMVDLMDHMDRMMESELLQ